jgi:curved DNA binding protein
LKHVISLCKAGASINDICTTSDAFIKKALMNIYTKKKYIKGLAFPTSIAVNEVCGNYSPAKTDLKQEEHEYRELTVGDVVKIDLGVQIQGFASVLAHTLVVTAKPDEVVVGRKADIILAAYYSVQAALRMLKCGNTNNQVTDVVKRICDTYKVNPVEGVLSHRMKRDIIDGLEVIINKATIDQKVDQREFAFGDIFGFDTIVSTGEGKPREVINSLI